MQTLKVGLLQMRLTRDGRVNRARASEMIGKARGHGAELIVLPELQAGLYFCQSESSAAFDLAEPIPGPSTVFYSALAKRLGVVLVVSIFERRAPGVFHNTAVVIDRDGRIAGKYRKMHIPDDPGYYEKYYFTPGDLGFTPIQTAVGVLGVLICWDQWYPEAARLMAMAGADLLIYPTAIGWTSGESAAERRRQREAWIAVQRGHAIANGLSLISVNRVGLEPHPGRRRDRKGIYFWGSSFVCGPQGEFLAEAGARGEEILLATVDRRRSEQVRRAWPFFRDRRIDAYGDLLRRYRV